MLDIHSLFMNQKDTQQKKEKPLYRMFSSDSHKACPYCGQGNIPFKLGVCTCGVQVGKIQYVQNSETFAKNYYSQIESPKTEKLGILEPVDY